MERTFAGKRFTQSVQGRFISREKDRILRYIKRIKIYKTATTKKAKELKTLPSRNIFKKGTANAGPTTLLTCLMFIVVALLQGCSKPAPPPLPLTKKEFFQKEEAKLSQYIKDEEKSRDLLDQELRLASMALDVGDQQAARRMLEDATSRISGNVDGKTFERHAREALKVLGGEEREKYFLGDPYEQYYAFLYLGILDFQAGNYELARASFRSAILADQGVGKEGYNSDGYLAFLLEGVTNRILGDTDQSELSYRQAKDAFMFRGTLPLLENALVSAIAQMIPEYEDKFHIADYIPFIFGPSTKDRLEQLDRLYSLIHNKVPATLALEKDPKAAMKKAFAMARLEVSSDPDDESSAGLLLEKSGDPAEALSLLDRFEGLAIGYIDKQKLEQLDLLSCAFDHVIEVCRDERTNLFTIYQADQGPAKIRMGEYGEMVHMRPYPRRTSQVLTSLLKEEPDIQDFVGIGGKAEDTFYQATTRGGRAMDYILGDRVVYKKVAHVTAGLASTATNLSLLTAAGCAALMQAGFTTFTWTVTSSAGTTTTYSIGIGMVGAAALVAAVGAYAIYQVALAVGDAIHPEGDIRGWHELPGQLYFWAAQVPPGNYKMVFQPYDNLGRPALDLSNTEMVTVETSRPVMLLTGSPWR